jgi:hypothetical protein
MRTLLLAAAVAASASCGADGPTADDACTQVAAANCAKIDQCIKNGTAIRYGDAPTCQARQKQSCLTALKAPGTGNSPTLVQTCATALPAASCEDYEQGNVTACQRNGARSDGMPCAYPGQCKSGFCAINKGTNCGSCAEPTQAGASCATTTCSRGQVCANNNQCQPDGTQGTSCDRDHPCGYGLSCVGSSTTATGTCQASGMAAGTACDPIRKTAPACAGSLGFFCSSTTNMCAPITYVSAGSMCGLVSGAQVNCTAGSDCFGDTTTTPGTCKAQAADGMPCDTAAGPNCLPPARCVTGSATVTAGTCRLPDAAACEPTP